MKKGWIIAIVIVVIILLYGFVSYNGLVTANEGINSQWAKVETQYQRRFELIPNLVESVKGIMKQEQAVFTAIADARTHYAGAQTVDDKAKAAGEVESALGRLLVITENYPELKSSDTVQTLMAELEGTENRISVERTRYNDFVQTYNLKVKTFPTSIMAKIFGFSEHAYFQSATGAETAPKVSF
ncbi:MAG: LemA family protein [Candidatus Pacebacteria bacterium]|nr:LemA family protein [Candidatus Paceibacterota bacterium]MDD5356981.1 LemA family protein [Candidatus Paceibacterota bacterium]